MAGGFYKFIPPSKVGDRNLENHLIGPHAVVQR